MGNVVEWTPILKQPAKHLSTVNGERCHEVVRTKVSGVQVGGGRQIEAPASIAALARRFEIHPALLSKWRQLLRHDPERAFRRGRQQNDEQTRVGELERMVGRG